MAGRAALPIAPEAQKNTRKSYTTDEKLRVTARRLSTRYLNIALLKCTVMIIALELKRISLAHLVKHWFSSCGGISVCA